VKCRLLGWWADEMKGYRLEDIETGKLITSQDVRFVEDESPGDLVVVETRGAVPMEGQLDELVPKEQQPTSYHPPPHQRQNLPKPSFQQKYQFPHLQLNHP